MSKGREDWKGIDKYGLFIFFLILIIWVLEFCVCNMVVCLEIVVWLMWNMNEFVDLCEDFFYFVCDGWIWDNFILLLENEYIIFIKKI